MTAPAPTSRLRRWSAAVAVALMLTTGCTNQAWDPAAPPAAGVQADAGPIKARNFLLVAGEDGNGVLLGSIAASEASTLTQVAVQAETADGGRGSAVIVKATGDIARGGVMKFQDVQVTGAGLIPGRLAYVALQFSDGTQLLLDAPVMSAEHPDFKLTTSN